MNAGRTGPYRRLFARYYDRFQSGYERRVAERKRRMFRDVSGTVVEIGAGTGINLKLLPPGCRWIGIEPNLHMHDVLRGRIGASGIEARAHVGDARDIPLASEVADVVVSTLVLCSVGDVERTLEEIRRVLRPGGRFLFIEHVAAPRGSALRWVQRMLTPAWRLFGDGCRLTCDTRESIEAAGFGSVEVEEFRVPDIPVWVRPHIAGVAVRGS